MSIYQELSDFEDVLLAELEKTSGEITPDVEALLDYRDETKRDCFERLGKVYLGKQYEIENLKAEKKRIDDRIKTKENDQIK